MQTKRINLWSSPRNVSTALMYSFAQRQDTTVVDEPLYAHYLTKTNSAAQHPVAEEIIEHQENDGEKVIDEVIFGSYERPVVIFKQMTHHFIELSKDFLKETVNVLLIRDPRAIIASYSKIIPNPQIDDIGVRKQLELYEELQQVGTLAAILEARELLLNPEVVLQRLCARLGLEFDPHMLYWDAGPRPEDGIWADHWYANVHRSTGFQPYVEKEIQLSKELEELALSCLPYYQRLYAEAIKHN